MTLEILKYGRTANKLRFLQLLNNAGNVKHLTGVWRTKLYVYKE